MKLTVPITSGDRIQPLRSPVVPLTFLAACRLCAKRNLIGANDLLIAKECQSVSDFLDQDSVGNLATSKRRCTYKEESQRNKYT